MRGARESHRTKGKTQLVPAFHPKERGAVGVPTKQKSSSGGGKVNGVGAAERAGVPDVHESHRDFLSGPAQVALRASIHAARRRLPGLLRALLIATAGILGLAVLLL